ncbi:hypothetical protein K7X08_014936 [Anisodus acutangulus]|uniref:Uncharacterized protein n=1 Tax=Anisodus acutangulus TaxID=402998 RepID=A0A9Q1LJ74_9SOLA|nr:hypothetical protein K7X08_014936 [Anisodus acutangulus]
MAPNTQAAKFSAATTKLKEDEQATKDAPLETINVNAGVNNQSRKDVLPQGGDVVSEGGNESVDVTLGTRNEIIESVVAPPPEDNIVRPQASQVTGEVPAKATPPPGDIIMWPEDRQVAEEVMPMQQMVILTCFRLRERRTCLRKRVGWYKHLDSVNPKEFLVQLAIA